MKRNYPSQDGGEAHPDHAYEPVPPLRAILTEPVVLSIASHIWLCFTDIAYRALQPLFYATPIHLGGLGMSPAKIGLFLGGFGILNGVVQGLFFAKIVRRIGLKKLFLTGTLCFIPLFAMFPIISHFVRKWGLSPAVQALAVFQIMINCVTAMCFGRRLLLDVRMSLTLSSPLLSRLRVPIHDLLCGESAGTREREWPRTNGRLTFPSAGSSDCNAPLRVHARERLVRRTRGLCRVHRDIPMRYTHRI